MIDAKEARWWSDSLTMEAGIKDFNASVPIVEEIIDQKIKQGKDSATVVLSTSIGASKMLHYLHSYGYIIEDISPMGDKHQISFRW